MENFKVNLFQNGSCGTGYLEWRVPVFFIVFIDSKEETLRSGISIVYKDDRSL